MKKNNDSSAANSPTVKRIREVKQQVWAKRKRRARIILAVLGIAAVILATANLKKLLTTVFWDMELFKVKEVRITPYKARALITGLMELESGGNILFLDIDGLREQILRIKEVENCSIRKIYPSTLEIEAVLRKPWITIEKSYGTVFVDRDGRIVESPDTPNLFVNVRGVNLGKNGVEEGDFWKIEVLKEIEKWYNACNLQKHFSIGNITIAKPTEIILSDEEASRRIFITGEDVRGKFEQLRIVLDECEKNGTGWDYVDIRFENPYVKQQPSSQTKDASKQ